MYVTDDVEAHPFVCPASSSTYRFTGHVTKAYVSDSNQIMVAYWSVYSDFSPTLYINLNWTMISQTKACIIKSSCVDKKIEQGKTTVNLSMELNPSAQRQPAEIFYWGF